MKIAFVFNKKRNDSVEQAEFDTEETISAISQALTQAGHQVIEIEMAWGDSAQWIRRLITEKPDLVFNTAEGHYGVGRESFGPTLFEQLQMPYVGTGPYGCFLTLDKFLTKQRVAHFEVPVVEGVFLQNQNELEHIAKEFVFPVFVKPNFEGSSKGITSKSLCRNAEELISYGAELLKSFPQGILVERYIAGRDIAVPYIEGLGDSGVLEPIEYVYAADSAIYDYDLKNKAADEAVQVRCPAEIDATVRSLLVTYMKKAVQATGVEDFARADFRLTPEGELYFLEMNALPSLQPGAGIFEATQKIGLNYNQTIIKIIEAAVSRLKIQKQGKLPKRMRTRNPRVALVYNLKRFDKSHPQYEKEAEFDSPATIEYLTQTLRKIVPDARAIEATRTLSEDLKENRIDIVFNIAEGTHKRAREAQVPALCDLLGIEHTGSDATCLAITLDKSITKKLLFRDGVLTPGYFLYQGGKLPEHRLKFPLILKPNYEGTSKGITESSVVKDSAELAERAPAFFTKYGDLLCEEYIEGREFTVGLLGNATLKVIGPMEIVFKLSDRYPVYSFEAKTAPAFNNPYFHTESPAKIPKELERKIHWVSKKIFRAIGCRDLARIDFRVSNKNEIYFLEVNPLPGLTPGFSDLVLMAENAGLNYEALIRRILMPAITRWRAVQ